MRTIQDIVGKYGNPNDFEKVKLVADDAFLAGQTAMREQIVNELKTIIYAQETGINQQAELLGLDKWLNDGILKTKYQQDKLEGQKDLLRWIEKGFLLHSITPHTGNE